ncbi:hypothetical protein [Mesorhizobium sp.]|uniref:hypothetical protein n=1 Tax=Mesorhizobium sp. TaxID=1871066 RepID=UPI000FE313E9|nr:hypothetical protein [Mesorhizobium sp.]RWO01806.1 MAG: hypothetical protein EOS06_06145 [Mesorhizobium sp.]RWO56001.1 MAG: hypothetical protein EOS13_02750 [Mesorhizobium sp.]TIN39191.1 MAG: hypothetical protein E5Y13_13850 [Mesorhizobium sp.]TJU92894.1 MAG: hypothetical protein E5Y10_02540 [Mesorhizobium sp.]
MDYTIWSMGGRTHRCPPSILGLRGPAKPWPKIAHQHEYRRPALSYAAFGHIAVDALDRSQTALQDESTGIWNPTYILDPLQRLSEKWLVPPICLE